MRKSLSTIQMAFSGIKRARPGGALSWRQRIAVYELRFVPVAFDNKIMRKVMKLDFRILSLSLSVLAATPVLGQDSSEASVLEEVIVTARRAEENLQKVPLSITAIGAKDIEAAGITSPEDIAALTPGFSYRTNGRAGALPVMRGMSNILGAANVSFFIDGVVASGSIAGYNLDNVERIEVIRGPQSALFGRNTFAGAVNYVTRKPTDVFKGNVKLTVGEFNNQDFSGWASGPIVEGKLRFEVNGRYMNKDGQYTNLVSGKKDIGGVQTKSIGATMDWAPSDWFEATLRTNYSVDRDELPAQVAIGGPGTGLSGAQVLNCYLPLAGTRRRGYFCGTLPTLNFLSANTTSYEQAGVQAGRQANQFSSSLVLNAEWRDYTFTSTTSYDTNSSYGASDQDFSALRGGGGAFETFGFNGLQDLESGVACPSPRNERLRWPRGSIQVRGDSECHVDFGALVANPIAGQPGLPPNVTPQSVDSSTRTKRSLGCWSSICGTT